jgi:hypothetical protein
MLYPNRIKIVIIYKIFFCNHDFFYKIAWFFINIKKTELKLEPQLEPELESQPQPQFVILAPAPGDNLFSAPWLLALHCFLR